MSNPFQEVLDLQESLKKGDSVHVGHMTPGGSGVSGKVEKVEDDKVYIRHDNGNLYKGLLKNTTKLKSTKEEVELEEKKLTPAELKKREEIANAMEKDNPGMDMSKKMAIATAVAKRVAESKEEKKEDDVPFSGPYKKEPTKTSPYRLVRKLARKYQKEHPVKEEAELEESSANKEFTDFVNKFKKDRGISDEPSKRKPQGTSDKYVPKGSYPLGDHDPVSKRSYSESEEYEDLSLLETADKEHPIYKEYVALKKMPISDLKNVLKQQKRIVDTSEYRSKDHIATTILNHKHGRKKVAAAFGLSEEVELDEAVKLGSKVVIHAPGKSYHGKVGRVGEIRHGLFKGAPKTYTVDYDHDKETGHAQSIQLDKKNVRLVKEDSELEESDVIRTQGGRKMVSAAAFLKYANDEAKKRGLKKATPDLVKSLSQKHGISSKE